MPCFILETYVPRLSAGDLDDLVAYARQAVTGTPVTYIRSYFVPEDEMCMHVFDGPSVAAVRQMADTAGLESERIVQSVGELVDHIPGRHP